MSDLEMLDGIIMQSELQKIGLAMRVLADANLDGIIHTFEMAHAIGPFIDPTKYMDALSRGDMDAMGKLASLLKEPVAHWKKEIAPKLKD